MKTEIQSNVKLLGQEHREVQPLHDWVFVARVSEEETTEAGIVIPREGAAEEAEVTAVGPISPSKLKPGDRVKFIGRALGIQVDGEHYYVLRDAQPGTGEMHNKPNGDPDGPPFIICVVRRSVTYQ